MNIPFHKINYDNNKIALTLLKCMFKEPFEIPEFVVLTSDKILSRLTSISIAKK